MDSELQFAWPDQAHAAEDEWCPPEWLTGRSPDRHPASEPAEPDAVALQQKLAEAQEAIARLEADRRTARKMIGDLEAANDELHARMTAQRRRMLLLERQLEDANVQPVFEKDSKSSWLDRLFGGLTSVPTAL